MEGLTFEGEGKINPLSPHPDPLRQKTPYPSFQKKVIVIAGPTASGKTALSLELARVLDGEIISADSIQVYRGMDIGTAKATTEERLEIPHHLIDTCDLCENFNVVQFCDRATELIKDILKRDKVPIVVGGTGFYLHSLIYGPPKGPATSPEVRQKISCEIERLGTEALYEKLCHYDPEYAETISHRDKQKVIRALEIISLTGKKVTDFPRSKEVERPKEFDFFCWFIHFPREILYPQIEMRCDKMIASGLIEEVKSLKEKGLEANHTASQAIGYRQTLAFLNSPQKDEDWEAFVWELKKVTRRYAKRQFTWFRKEDLFKWIDIDKYGYQKTLEFILQDYERMR